MNILQASATATFTVFLEPNTACVLALVGTIPHSKRVVVVFALKPVSIHYVPVAFEIFNFGII